MRTNKRTRQERQRVDGVLFGIPSPASIVTASDTGNTSLEAMYPGWASVGQREAVMVGLPATGAAYFAGGAGANTVENAWASLLGVASGGDEVPLKHVLPEERSARYAVLRLMAKDPTIDSAIKMHISNALSSKSDTVESVYIKPADADGKPNKIVDDLRATLMPIIKKDANEWARKAAVYGSCFGRVYGKQGVGIQSVRCDFHTHPRFIQKFEKGGRLAGYTATYQGASSYARQLRLLPPWTFVGFEIPEWWDSENIEPINVGGIPVDLSVEDPAIEGLVESQEYGTSLIATAYGPWMDLLDAICSLKMSRRNAARLERIIGVNTGKLDPERAARYLDQIAERVTNASNDIQTQSYLHGTVQTVVNHILPNFTDKGGIQVEAVQGSPDINGLEDVLFQVKRLGGAIGVDPSLLGFGDFLSGGLGDGGYFRMSIMAAVKADLLRKAIKNGIHRLCEIHVAYKYGKVFLPDECPWEIGFNSVSTAIEREEQESLEARTNAIGGIIGSFGVIDQEFSIADKRELAREVWKMLRLDEDAFERVFPKEKAKAAEEAAAALAAGDGGGEGEEF
ncbi:MAG: hypothetical protein E7022_03315 [Desulfovibrio desulfuricans]|nr:hypothetical protein [Desulfovibrio desulfuricans]